MPHQSHSFISLSGSTAFIGLLLLVQCVKLHDATCALSMFVGLFVMSTTTISAMRCNMFVMLLIGVFTLGFNNNGNTSNDEHDN